MTDVAEKFMLMAERAFKQRDAMAAALEQIRMVCTDNADNSLSKSQQGMALAFVEDVAVKTLAKHMQRSPQESTDAG